MQRGRGAETRVLQLVSSAGLFGAERVLLELACYLNDHEVRCWVGALTTDARESRAVLQKADALGLPTVAFAARGAIDLQATRAIRTFMVRERIGVVHTHNYKSDILAFLARLPSTVVKVATCHNWLSDSPKLMLYELVDKLVLHQFDRVAVVSVALHAELASAGIRAPKCARIDNGVALDEVVTRSRAAVRHEFGVDPGEALIVTIGRFDRWKAYEQLVEAFALVAPHVRAKLMLVGDGDRRRSIEAAIARSSLEDRVILPGYRIDVADLLRSSDIFVLSSIKEGLPMVLLEAMAARLPVVATRVGAIPEVLDDGGAGDLVAANDPQALGRCLRELVQNPTRARTLSERAYARYQARYSREAMGARYLALYGFNP